MKSNDIVELLNVLGAPNSTTFVQDSNDQQTSTWTKLPNWDDFYQRFLFLVPKNDSDNNKKNINMLMQVILSIETIPVPPKIMQDILKLYIGKKNDDVLLHTAIQNPCFLTDTYSVLLSASPQLNNHPPPLSALWLLLHQCYACNNVNVAKSIIDFQPSVLKHANPMGLLPIHAAFGYRQNKRSDMVRLLLQEGVKRNIFEDGCGGVFSSSKTSDSSPIDLALYYLRQGYRNLVEDNDEDKEDIGDKWQCLSICYDVVKSSKPNFQLLNYIIQHSINMDHLVKDIVQRLDIDLNASDDLGMTPLLVAIQLRKVGYIKTLLKIRNGNCAKYRMPHCQIDHKIYRDCYPLHIALQLGLKWEDGLKHIHECYPEAVSIAIPFDESHLYPFMVAAGNNALEECYRLLQSDVGVVESCEVNDITMLQNMQFLLLKFIANDEGHYHFLMGAVLSVLIMIAYNYVA